MTAVDYRSKQADSAEANAEYKVPCKYAKHGCSVTVSRSRVEAHEQEFLAVHLTLLEEILHDKEVAETELRDRQMATAMQAGTKATEEASKHQGTAKQAVGFDHCDGIARLVERMRGPEKINIGLWSGRRSSQGPGIAMLLIALLAFCVMGPNWFLRIPLAMILASIAFKTANSLLPRKIAGSPAKCCWYWIAAFFLWRFQPIIRRVVLFVLFG